jgi:scyllo-inositol 2-dehydrogenase (NADP+)
MVRVGLIGFGLAGQAFHAPMIRGVRGMELACVLERNTNNAKQRYPDVRIARSLDELLSDKTINLVVVATPNDSHYSYAKAILEADRHVVVDKPLTPTMKEAEELVRLATQEVVLGLSGPALGRCIHHHKKAGFIRRPGHSHGV